MELDLETTPHSKDATLVDSRTKRPLYRITDFVLSLFKYKPNIVSRLSEVADKEEDLAEIKRGWFGDYITLESDGVRMKANKLFDVGVLQGYALKVLIASAFENGDVFYLCQTPFVHWARWTDSLPMGARNARSEGS